MTEKPSKMFEDYLWWGRSEEKNLFQRRILEGMRVFKTFAVSLLTDLKFLALGKVIGLSPVTLSTRWKILIHIGTCLHRYVREHLWWFELSCLLHQQFSFYSHLSTLIRLPRIAIIIRTLQLKDTFRTSPSPHLYLFNQKIHGTK